MHRAARGLDAPDLGRGIPLAPTASRCPAAAGRRGRSVSTIRSRYARISSPRAYVPDQSGFGWSAKPYRCDGHVARDAGVGVVAPGAADGCRALEHDEVVAARAAQRHRHAEPGEAGADDRDLDAGRSELAARSRAVEGRSPQRRLRSAAARGSPWCAGGTAGTAARRGPRHPPPAVRGRARCRPRASPARRGACRRGRRRRRAAARRRSSRPTRVHGIWMCGMLPLSSSRETATIARCSSSGAAAGDERDAAGGSGERDRHELGEARASSRLDARAAGRRCAMRSAAVSTWP